MKRSGAVWDSLTATRIRVPGNSGRLWVVIGSGSWARYPAMDSVSSVASKFIG